MLLGFIKSVHEQTCNTQGCSSLPAGTQHWDNVASMSTLYKRHVPAGLLAHALLKTGLRKSDEKS